ncbi:MAG: hypothetical protein QM296_11185 [Bacillota bacterium]|nr:hypothetical protein [Bacillota bacterium]
MKRILPLLLIVLTLVGLAACSAGRESTGSVVTTKAAETGGVLEKSTSKAQTTTPVSEAGQEETLAELPERQQREDFQAGIPEEYRLKINVPADWNDPLPTENHDFKFPLFAVGQYLDAEQQAEQEPPKLPRVIDLFTIEELEEYFGMTLVLSEEGRNVIIENRDKELYLIYKTDASRPGHWDGKLEIALRVFGDRLSALSYMSMVVSEPKEIEGLGKRALLSKRNAVYILIADTVLLGINLGFVSPENRMPVPMDEDVLLDFSRRVYERCMEKMESIP